MGRKNPHPQVTNMVQIRCSTCGDTATVPKKGSVKALTDVGWESTKLHGWVCNSCVEDERHTRGIQHADIVWFKGYNRHWVVLLISQWILDNTDIDVDKPGLYAFGGLWYGDKLPDRHAHYGKVLPIPKDAVVVGRIWDFTKDFVAELVD